MDEPIGFLSAVLVVSENPKAARGSLSRRWRRSEYEVYERFSRQPSLRRRCPRWPARGRGSSPPSCIG